MKQLILRLVSFICALIFAAFFILTFYVPNWVEDFAQDFLEHETLKKIDKSIDAIKPSGGNSRISKLAELLYEKNETKINEIKVALKTKAHEQMVDAIAKIRDISCECRAKWEKLFKQGFENELNFLEAANEKITDFIHSKYMGTLVRLRKDIRIFTCCNMLAFLSVYTEPVCFSFQ